MRIHIPLPPSGFQRPRPGKNGGYYSPHKPALLDWQGLIKNQMRVGGHSIIEGPVSVHALIGPNETILEILPVVGVQPARPKGVKQDLDNLFKFDADALEKYAYFNDVQIVDLAARFTE